MRINWKLFKTVQKGDLAGVKAAVEAGANVNAINVMYMSVLGKAVQSAHSDAFAIVKYLVEKGAKTNAGNGWAVKNAAGNKNPDALAMVKFLVEHRANIRPHNGFFGGALTNALVYGNIDIADYFLSRDDFLLSDFMPCHNNLPLDVYRTFRGKAIAYIIESIDQRGIPYRFRA